MKFIILIKPNEEKKPLTFITTSFVKQNGFIEFTDKNGKYKSFSLDQLKEVSQIDE